MSLELEILFLLVFRKTLFAFNKLNFRVDLKQQIVRNPRSRLISDIDYNYTEWLNRQVTFMLSNDLILKVFLKNAI